MKYLDKTGLTYLWSKIKSKIPTKTSDLTNDSGFSTFSGSYDDLTDKPTIPSVGNAKTYYGTSTTAATTAAKTATCSGFVLEEGTTIFIKFTNGNSYNGTATLNVNSTGTKEINFVANSNATRYYWKSGEVVGFVYDGSEYIMIEKAPATTTYYGITKLSSSTSSTSETLAATPKAVKTAYDLASGKQETLVSGTNIKTINSTSLLGSGDISVSTFSGSYDDLTNKPTIPTVNNATLTIQKNGTTVKTFTANASSNVTANITVPTKVSDLTNDSGYTTNTGTITSVKMNGSTVASSGEANLGTVLTSHQSIKTINSNTITGTGNVSVGTITKVQANGTDVASSGTANIPAATTSAYGVTQLSSSTSSTSTSLAATPSAVKSAYDEAASAWAIGSGAAEIASQNATNIGDMDDLIGGTNLVDAINEANDLATAANSTIKVVETSFTSSGSGTGWKYGSFTHTAPTGYKLIAVTTNNVKSADRNFFMFNINGATIYWAGYIGYGNYGANPINLIYVKEDNIA